MEERDLDPVDAALSADKNLTMADNAAEQDAVQEDATERVDANTLHAQGSSLSPGLQRAVDKTLDFLSHASNETLGACLVGLGATTYFILGKVGLIIIGVAGGVVLHATWEGVRRDDRDEETKELERLRRKEAGVEVARRILDWRTTRAIEAQPEDTRAFAEQRLDFSAFDRETAKALETFTDAVIKDYVYYWYGPTLPGEESFPASCRRTLTSFILSLSGHLERKRPADAFLDFVTNASSIIIVFLNELAAATNACPNSSAEDAVAAYLKMKPDSSLAYLLNEQSQNRRLSGIAEDILQAYLDAKSYNCPPVRVFLKEVLAQLVLGSTITLCSRPEWINEWIVYGLEESETASKVMNIVDAGVEGRDTARAPANAEPEAHSIQKPKRYDQSPPVPVQPSTSDRQREVSKAEEAMDEAMQEAKRLTQLMIEEDERRARGESENRTAVSSSEDVSDVPTTHGATTPTSSQSDRERQDEEAEAWRARSTFADTPSPVTAASPNQNIPQFTSFDQVVPTGQPTALGGSYLERPQVQLTLHLANISIFDDSQPGERSSIKAKPTIDYLIQIEPNSSAFPGWMIARKYADFETLHEVLRRISVVTGVTGFAEAHAALPPWRGNTKANLRSNLERYLIDAVKFQPLAESEGMKRFLEKDQGLSKSPGGKGFGWPTPDAFGKLGGDMMGVLTKAPKQVAGGVAGGGKAVFGGVTGLVGGPKRPINNQSSLGTAESTSSPSRSPGTQTSAATLARESQESLPASNVRPPHIRQQSSETTASLDLKQQSGTARSSIDVRNSLEPLSEDAPFALSQSTSSLAREEKPLPPVEDKLLYKLPPPPSEMPADYGTNRMSAQAGAEVPLSTNAEVEEAAPRLPPRTPKAKSRPKQPLDERETIVAVELMFAVITELYTLSSAWNFRRTLLSAAKTFLLRPGNPQLVAIRDLLQTSLLDSNLSDAGLASHILKLRENGLPTAEELEAWSRDYPEKTAEQKEELRVKARKLLVTKGMPQALTSVMGAAASGEALGKVFDCLQVESVSRGLIFGLMLQALRVVTH